MNIDNFDNYIDQRKPLPKDIQIEILKQTLILIEKEGIIKGLCERINRTVLIKFGETVGSYKYIQILIPKFNRKYASKYYGGIHGGDYWWPLGSKGYYNRIEFLKGIIKELERPSFKQRIKKFLFHIVFNHPIN